MKQKICTKKREIKMQMCSIKITNINNDSFMDYVEEIERRALEANMTLIERIDLDTSKIVLFWTHSPKIEVMIGVLYFQKDIEDEDSVHLAVMMTNF
jgi:23S rRNA maturation mini-RNase III